MGYIGTSTYEHHNRLAEEIEAASGGRIEVTLTGADVVCGTFQMFDAVKSGLLDMCYTSSSYIYGFVPCMEYGWGIGGMLPTLEDTCYLTWYIEPRSWQDILQDALLQHNMHAVAVTGVVTYGEFFSTVPINRLADMDGLMIRSFGDIGKIWERAGAELVTVSAGEMYTALALGTIDAANWGDARGFRDMHIEEIAPYFIGPPIMKYGEEGEFMNLDTWNSLPADLQEICTLCDRENLVKHVAENGITSAEAKAYFSEEWGTTFIEWPQEDVDACMALAVALTMEREPKDQWCAERVSVLTDYMEAMGYL